LDVVQTSLDMPQPASTVREEHLQKLEPFCRALAQTLGGAGVKPEKTLEEFKAGLTAECEQCGIHLSGEELYALSQPPSEKYANVKLGRLRLGDCARQGCQSYFYRLTFRDSPSLDWPKLIERAEAIQRGETQASAPKASTRETLRRAVFSSLAIRVALAMVLAVMLLAMRQWYLGGEIPFLRHAEHFHVATVSASEESVMEEHHDGD
jgi:hypothetical protein